MNEHTEQTAPQKRAAHPDFVPTFSLDALREQLPLPFPIPDDVSPSPKRQYRSQYRYRGYEELADPAVRKTLTPFEMALRLIDFSPLRDYLAAHYYTGRTRGQVPFDPVSLFLCLCLRREQNLSWRALAQLLAGEHGAGWRRLFGFQDGVTPSEAGLRYFFNTVGQEVFDELCPLFIDLLHAAGLLPEQSTFPGDPPGRGVTISHDLMLHEARSNMRCAKVTDTCYQPAPRSCPAHEAGQRGCACDSEACAQACCRATPRDTEARYIHYTGRNKHAYEETPNQGRHVYGYASTPDRLIDDRFACAWTLRTGLEPANMDERNVFPNTFASLRARFPYLNIGEVLADAALGYRVCLDPIREAGALCMVDIRAAEGDEDPAVQLKRGYDAQGHPLCIHGYPMRSNGHDYDRRRTKWRCAKVCLSGQVAPVGTETPPPAPDCPFQAPEHKHGQIVNVGPALPDGNRRLAREVPYGTARWKQRYGRRNLSESRNGSLEGMGLKRLPDFGLERNSQEIAVADFLLNLRTLGRLVQEATTLALQGTA